MGGHESRDRHLFGPGSKRILSLDGGGVRGVISVAFLERIETILAGNGAPETKLSDYFDLMGGPRPARSSRPGSRSERQQPN
jgi:hypothetical protein